MREGGRRGRGDGEGGGMVREGGWYGGMAITRAGMCSEGRGREGVLTTLETDPASDPDQLTERRW